MAYQDNNHGSYLKSVFHSFVFALEGVRHTFKNERNFRIESAIALLALALGIVLRIDKGEWLLILLCIGWVLGLEMMNTGIEAVVDLISEDQFHPLAKVAKDVGAGAVFLAAMISLIIGLVIFIPHLLQLLIYWGIL